MATGERRLVDFGGQAALQLAKFHPLPTYEEIANAIQWTPSQSIVFGKTHQTGRLVSTMGTPYSYNGASPSDCSPMPDVINQIANSLTTTFGIEFTTCVANLYPNGTVGLAAHDDGEKYSSIIVSVSFGAPRKIVFTKKDKSESHSFLLKNGDVCAMCGEDFQRDWKHAVPKDKSVSPRISLTFRSYHL